jgi:hypothetical protein
MRKAAIFSTAITLMSKIFRGSFNYTDISGYMAVQAVQHASLKEDEIYA